MDLDPLAPAVAALRRGDEDAHLYVNWLHDLTMDEEEQDYLDAVREAGVIPPLVALLKRGSPEQKINTLALLETIARSHLNQAVIREAGGIPLLVPFFRSSSATAKRTAADLLITLALGDAESKVAFRKAGGIPPLLHFWKSSIEGWDLAGMALETLAHDNDDNEVAIALARGCDAVLVGLAWRGDLDPGRVIWDASAGAQRKAKLAVVALVCKCNWHFKRLDFPAVPHVLNAAIASYLY